VKDGFIDVTTGHLVRLAPDRTGDRREPEAWSPDGRELATVEYTEPEFLPPPTYTGEWTNPVTRASLAVVDVATVTRRRSPIFRSRLRIGSTRDRTTVGSRTTILGRAC